MDEVVKNTHAFVDILCMARGQAVQSWGEETFHRAFKWAQYFEQVHSKLKSKPALADKLDRYINNFNKTTTVYLGTFQLSFNQLGESKDVLRKCLLQNPYLTTSQFGHVLKLYDINIGSQNEAKKVETLKKDVVQLMNQKGALSLLSQMRDKMTADSLAHGLEYHQETVEPAYDKGMDGCGGLEVCTAQRIATDTSGQLLFKCVQHFIQYSENKDHGCLQEKLAVISNQENGLETITSCLLYLPDDCQFLSKADTVQKFILKWLLDSLESNPNHSFWSLPLPILSRISFQYDDILKLYLDGLVSWGNKMTPLLTYQLPIKERPIHNQVYVWRCPEDFSSDVKTGTFETLVQHLKHLTSGPVHVQDLCYKTITEIIPDYDKHTAAKEIAKLGINIWKDVYNALTIEHK